jgi:hypothetical protein
MDAANGRRRRPRGQRKAITELADLPVTDFRIHTLNFTGITMRRLAAGRDAALPALPHLKSSISTDGCGATSRQPRLADRAVCHVDGARETRAQQAEPRFDERRGVEAGPTQEFERVRISETEIPDGTNAVAVTHLGRIVVPSTDVATKALESPLIVASPGVVVSRSPSANMLRLSPVISSSWTLPTTT